MTATKTAAIFGATGEVGKQVLQALNATAEFTVVHDFRRSLPAPSSAKATALEHRLTQIDFDKLLAADQGEVQKVKSVNADVLFITLGTTPLSSSRDSDAANTARLPGTTKATAGSADAFIKIDRDYVLAAARAARVRRVLPSCPDQAILTHYPTAGRG